MSQTLYQLNPWVPMSDKTDLRIIGKLLEELGEATAAASRCFIQGIDEKEPVTGKVNREWLEDELADVLCNIELVVEHFRLKRASMIARERIKREHLKGWHAL